MLKNVRNVGEPLVVPPHCKYIKELTLEINTINGNSRKNSLDINKLYINI